MAIINGVIENGKPIGGEVFTFFGIERRANGMYYWGDIPQSTLINVKSRHKPMNFVSDAVTNVNGVVFGRRTQLSPEQRRSRNYGHIYTVYNNAVDAIRGVAAGTNFVYDRPASWFRLPDLWGYNHSATNWYNFYTQITNLAQGSVQPIKQEGDITEIFTLSALNGLTPANVNFGFLCWNSAFSPTQSQVYFLSLTSLRNTTDNFQNLLTGEGLTLSTANIPVGTWRMYPVVTDNNTFNRHSFTQITEANPDYNGNWWPYPFADTLIINVVSQGQGDDNVIQYIDVDEPTYNLEVVDASNLVYMLKELSVTFRNTSNTAYTVNYELSFPKAGVTNTDGFPFSGTLNIAGGGSATVSYVKDKNEEEALRLQLAEGEVVLQVKYWVTVNGRPQTLNPTYELIAGK